MNNDLEKQGNAGDYINGILKAVEPVNVYSSPGGTLLRTVNPGNVIGTIDGFVTDNGNVYWMLTDNGFVMHEGKKFDFPFLEKSILDHEAKKQAEIDKRVEDRLANNSNVLYRIGKNVSEFGEFFTGNFKLIFISVIIIVILILIVKIKS